MRAGSSTYGIGLASAGAIAYLVVMFMSGAAPTHGNRVESAVNGILEAAPGSIIRVTLTAGIKTRTFERQGSVWHDATLARPLDPLETERLAAAISLTRNAPPVRVLRPEETAAIDAAAYGLDPPELSVRFDARAGPVLAAHFGGRANDDIVQYLRIDGRGETLLMSGFVGDAWHILLEPP